MTTKDNWFDTPKNSENQKDMPRAEIIIRRAMSCNTAGDRASALTTAWLGLDPHDRDAFVLGLISRAAMCPQENER
ncbi:MULTISPECIES: hypothetical protein [Acetobacter]|uniref:hypothetical protein n=1 Tax=Acetobacter TaxID=434 RepID=UPI000676B4E2|nr:hypothetical protein [Acetobacter pasteurianus]AKR49743.1 hypothetical protein DB34_13300 [Acetobacter pasteurianus]